MQIKGLREVGNSNAKTGFSCPRGRVFYAATPPRTSDRKGNFPPCGPIGSQGKRLKFNHNLAIWFTSQNSALQILRKTHATLRPQTTRHKKGHGFHPLALSSLILERSLRTRRHFHLNVDPWQPRPCRRDAAPQPPHVPSKGCRA